MDVRWTRRGFLLTVVSGLSAGLSGCVAELGPYQAKAASAPPIKNCFDTLGHQGFKPFVLEGGTCYCNPLPAQMAVWRKEGHFGDLGDDDILQRYSAREIKTLADHRDCNNLCRWGPHVAKGGKCLVPPTPLTDNYEEVATGKFKAAPTKTA
ncbi:MAG TPA: hypothetical protein VGT02_17050 [Methylomirabilota bacterium]|jgi:hypothetical protein|nr:hypothetical protein [Methylomirabilota bacterium]